MKDIYSEPVGKIIGCHREILSQSEKLEAALSRFRAGGSAEDMRLSLDVFLLFARTTMREHKAEEEDVLFPFLLSSGMPREQVESFLRDHDEIKEIAGLAEFARKAGKAERECFGKELSGALSNLRRHMEEEEGMLRSAACRTKGAQKLCRSHGKIAKAKGVAAVSCR